MLARFDRLRAGLDLNGSMDALDAYLKDGKAPPKWIQTESKLYTPTSEDPMKVYELKKGLDKFYDPKVKTLLARALDTTVESLFYLPE